MLFLGLAFLIGGGLALANGGRLAVQERTYYQRGEIVHATVTAKALLPATRDRGTSYAVSFRFIDTDGRPLEGRLPVDAVAWEALGPGSAIAVQYVPGDPGSVRLAGQTGRGETMVLLGLGLAFAVVGGAVVIGHGRPLVRDWRIMRSGVPVAATVTGASPTSLRINRRPQWVVHYRYTDAGGRQHDGRSPSMPVEAARSWEPGRTVDIRFDRERPAFSVWMEGERSPARRPSSEAATEPSSRLRRLASRYGFVVALVLGGLGLAVAAETVPVLRDFFAFVDRHWRLLFTATAGATGVGFVLFIGGIIHMLLTNEPSGRRGGLQVSIGEVKAAWDRRAWRGDVRWRCLFMIIGGAFLMGFGLFSSLGLLTESFVRFVLWLALAYAATRTAWAFYRA